MFRVLEGTMQANKGRKDIDSGLSGPFQLHSDLPATPNASVQQQHDSYDSNQLFSDWLQGLLHFMSGSVNLSELCHD